VPLPSPGPTLYCVPSQFIAGQYDLYDNATFVATIPDPSVGPYPVWTGDWLDE
jgi:hypothetical protein